MRPLRGQIHLITTQGFSPIEKKHGKQYVENNFKYLINISENTFKIWGSGGLFTYDKDKISLTN